MDYTNKGKRVKLVFTSDKLTKLVPGDKGVYFGFDSVNHCIQWDNGSTLSLIPGEDSFEFIK